MRDKIEKEAARGASDAAKDSQIGSHANRDEAHINSLFPSGVAAKFNNELQFSLDTSPAARNARIADRGGAIPVWARGDARYDPALLKAAEVAARTSAAPARAPAAAAARATARTSTAPAAAPAATNAGVARGAGADTRDR